MTRRRLSVDAIVAAVLELGIREATTGAVARRLGVEQPALYRHVGSKAELLDLAAASALQGMQAWIPDAVAAPAVASFQRALWVLLDAHRGLALHLLTTTEIPRPLLDAVERLVVALRDEAAVSVRNAILIADAAVHLTYLAHAGTERLSDRLTAQRWHDRSRQVASQELIAAIEEIEQADPLGLVIEQVALLTLTSSAAHEGSRARG